MPCPMPPMIGGFLINLNYHVITEIAVERMQQNDQWGGPEHDDTHDEHDWNNFLGHQLEFSERAERLEDRSGPMPLECRARWVKLAALAIAAIECHDRKYQAAQTVADLSTPPG